MEWKFGIGQSFREELAEIRGAQRAGLERRYMEVQLRARLHERWTPATLDEAVRQEQARRRQVKQCEAARKRRRRAGRAAPSVATSRTR